MLICNNGSNVHDLAKSTISLFDSERRQGRSDLRGMPERWKNNQPLKISMKTRTNKGDRTELVRSYAKSAEPVGKTYICFLADGSQFQRNQPGSAPALRASSVS